MLWRALKHIKAGKYVDIGASDPVQDSVSLLFYEHGWRGVHVEPNRKLAEKLRRARPNELVIEAAVTGRAGDMVIFNECVDEKAYGIGTINPEYLDKINNANWETVSYEVPTVTLDNILAMAGDEIHWLKIDVEGAEKIVLDGWHSHIRPWIVVIESLRLFSHEDVSSEWEPLILSLGYEFTFTDKLNKYYVHRDHQELKDSFRAGLSCLDGFSLAPSVLCVSMVTNCLTGERDLALAQRDNALDAITALEVRLNDTVARLTLQHEQAGESLAKILVLVEHNSTTASQIMGALTELWNDIRRFISKPQIRLGATVSGHEGKKNKNVAHIIPPGVRHLPRNILRPILRPIEQHIFTSAKLSKIAQKLVAISPDFTRDWTFRKRVSAINEKNTNPHNLSPVALLSRRNRIFQDRVDAIKTEIDRFDGTGAK